MRWRILLLAVIYGIISVFYREAVGFDVVRKCLPHCGSYQWIGFLSFPQTLLLFTLGLPGFIGADVAQAIVWYIIPSLEYSLFVVVFEFTFSIISAYIIILLLSKTILKFAN